ncbi:retrovirus-related pol polyprotein from transposon TNT 1-94 [Tanacetum coccineum]
MLEDGERMWLSIKKGPYEMPLIIDPDDDKEKILEPLSKMTKSNKKQYNADVKVMNYLLQTIPNDIYNSVDAFIDYEEDYQGELQGDSQEDKPTTAMINQAVVQDGRVVIQTKNAGYGGNGKANIQCYNFNEKGHYARDCPKLRVHDEKYFREEKLLAMKDEAGSNFNDEENDFMLDNSFEDETLEELTAAVTMMAQIQPVNENGMQKPKYDAKAVRKLVKKAFNEREDRYFEDIVDLEEKLSSHDRIVYKMDQSIQTIHMLGKTPNQVYDPFLKAGLGYKNPKHLKKAIAAQPKMYHGEKLYSTKLKFDSPDSEETLEDAKES